MLTRPDNLPALEADAVYHRKTLPLDPHLLAAKLERQLSLQESTNNPNKPQLQNARNDTSKNTPSRTVPPRGRGPISRPSQNAVGSGATRQTVAIPTNNRGRMETLKRVELENKPLGDAHQPTSVKDKAAKESVSLAFSNACAPQSDSIPLSDD